MNHYCKYIAHILYNTLLLIYVTKVNASICSFLVMVYQLLSWYSQGRHGNFLLPQTITLIIKH